MAAAVRLLTRIADYASQWLKKRVKVKKYLKESLKVGATWRRNRSVLFDHAQTTNPNDTNRKLGYVPIGH